MIGTEKKVSIVIPVYNEAKTVQTLLTQVCDQVLPKNLEKELVIVESNSTDGSREKVLEFVEQFKIKKAEGFSKYQNIQIKVILQDRPQGKGFAVREGLFQTSGDIILIQDADLEYQVSDYPMLIEPIIEGHADFVLGSRHLSAGTWKIRKFEENTLKALFMNIGGIFFHTFFNLVYRVKLTDPTTMYKVFRSECLRGVQFEGKRFDFDFELVAKLIRLGYIPLEVPIAYASRGFAEGKKVQIFLDPILYVIAILKFRIKRIRRFSRVEHKSILTNSGGVYDHS